MNFKRWAEAYAINYTDTIAYQNNKEKEPSPVFENISKCLQKRGYLQQQEFINICKWKTPRPIRYYPKNSSETIKTITKQVISEPSNTEACLSKLIELKGVSIPVASALLTVIFPEIYCIVDFRVWNSLLWLEEKKSIFQNYSNFSDFINNFRNYGQVSSYIYYMEIIKKLALKHGMTPRKIEMALWQYDKNIGRLIQG